MTSAEPSRRFAGHDPARGRDTARMPWAGREVTPSPFAADDGRADEAVRRALARVVASAPADAAAAEADALAVLAGSRLLMPIVAEAAASQGRAADDADSDMASIVLTAPDGRRGMPAFTGIDTLTAWEPSARPVPVRVADAARAALEDGCEAMPLDLGAPHAIVLRLSHLWALGQERPWVPPAHDPVVAEALARVTAAHGAITGVEAQDGSDRAPGLVRLVLTLVPGLAAPDIQRLVGAVGEALAGDPDVRVRVDDVTVQVRPGV